MITNPIVRRLRLSLLGALCAIASTAACVAGPDPVRVQAEQTSLALAELCARGWFEQLPVTEQDRRLVTKALADWRARLASDAQLVGGGVK